MEDFNIHDYFHNNRVKKADTYTPLNALVEYMGYNSVDQFFSENKGAFNATAAWLVSQPDFREKLSSLNSEKLSKLGLDSQLLEMYDFE